jgi:hypothetical protein
MQGGGWSWGTAGPRAAALGLGRAWAAQLGGGARSGPRKRTRGGLVVWDGPPGRGRGARSVVGRTVELGGPAGKGKKGWAFSFSLLFPLSPLLFYFFLFSLFETWFINSNSTTLYDFR